MLKSEAIILLTDAMLNLKKHVVVEEISFSFFKFEFEPGRRSINWAIEVSQRFLNYGSRRL